jgi:CheY-like chemotaxis protein
MSTILLVDDDPELLELYSDVLELMGHTLLRARDGREALVLARQRRPDLVVTDWMMPEMNGVELCQALASAPELQHIPVIMQSASGNPHAPHARVFLPKGCSLEWFEEVVTRMLALVPRQPPMPGVCQAA